MAKASGLDQKLYVHGYDLSGDVGSITNVEGSFGEFDTTDITQAAHSRILGLASGSLEFMSYFDDAAGKAHAVLSALPTTDVVLTWALGTAVGDRCMSLQAKYVSAYGINRSADASLDVTTRAEGSAGAPLEDGIMLTAADDTFASASSATGLDQTAQTTRGAVGYCQALSLGSGAPTILIEDSADSTNGVDGTWATLMTLNTATLPGASRVEATGTVDRWVRVTTTGTFTDYVVVVSLRRGLEFDIEDLS